MEVVFTNKIEEIDLDKLMDIYEESNWENLFMEQGFLENKKYDKNYLYQQVRKAYKDYIKEDFLENEKNRLAILKDRDTYLSALRVYDKGDFYLIEALETNPKFRRSGYGEKLVREVIYYLKKGKEIRSEVGKTNKKSLNLHRKIGFKVKNNNEKDIILYYNL